MKQYKFEIVLNDIDLDGDEFWEDIIKKDPTGITPLTEALADIIDQSNMLIGSKLNGEDVVKLMSYTDV